MAMEAQAPELTDDQIEQLLFEAEKRLASKNATNKTVTNPRQTNTSVTTTTLEAEEKESGKKSQDLAVRAPQLAAKKGKGAKDNAGEGWFHMPRTDLEKNPGLKKDLQLLRMRSILDPKIHWRKDTRKDFIPTYSQVGTLVESPLDFHNGRLTRKERKRTIVEEVLASTEATAKFKTRYNQIQSRKMSGKKAHYKKVVAQRRRRP